MKKIILFTLFITLFISCKDTTQQEATIYDPKVEVKKEVMDPAPKYKKGDVIYTKPDSTKAVIDDTYLNSSQPYVQATSIYEGLGRRSEDIYLYEIY